MGEFIVGAIVMLAGIIIGASLTRDDMEDKDA